MSARLSKPSPLPFVATHCPPPPPSQAPLSCFSPASRCLGAAPAAAAAARAHASARGPVGGSSSRGRRVVSSDRARLEGIFRICCRYTLRGWRRYVL